MVGWGVWRLSLYVPNFPLGPLEVLQLSLPPYPSRAARPRAELTQPAAVLFSQPADQKSDTHHGDALSSDTR